MGADKNHDYHHGLRPPAVPCITGRPPRPPNDCFVDKPHTEVVDAPARYAMAGRFLLASVGAFLAVLLALVVLQLYQSSQRRRRFRDRRRLMRSLAIVGEVERGGEAESPRGLDPAVLGALPLVDAGGGDCAVCLAEFEAAEKARALPRCGHRFHVECIDVWFRRNSTCPLCRATVEAPVAAYPAPPEVCIDVTAPATAAKAKEPAMGRLPSGTDLERVKRIFAATRSASF